MSDSLKIRIAILVVAGVFFLISVPVVSDVLATLFSPGELMTTAISPDSRWRVRFYHIHAGAGSSDRHYAEIVDSKGRVPTHEIDLRAGMIKGLRIKWENNDTMLIYNKEVNVRKNTVLLGTSISPTGRWEIKIYDIFPIKQRYGYTFAEARDLRHKVPNFRVGIKQDKWGNDNILWKDRNTVQIFGQEVELEKAARQKRFN